jgi:hypothetical protein
MPLHFLSQKTFFETTAHIWKPQNLARVLRYNLKFGQANNTFKFRISFTNIQRQILWSPIDEISVILNKTLVSIP